MPKRAAELTALQVQRINTKGFNSVGGVSGLGLYVSPGGARSWVLRYHVDGKRREMGLGAYPDVTLAQAKEKARAERDKLDKGHDPIALREAERRANAAARAARMTFKDAAKKLIAAKKPEWKNSKHAKQWESTLMTYAYPVIGDLDVRDISLPHILQILEPIWIGKNETASRLRGRIESVLDWSTVGGYREGNNPARWKGHLEHKLAKPSKVAKVEHHPALPFSEMPAFMARLHQQRGQGARALELAILTAARSNEVRGAVWAEIDLDAAMWVIPAARMKADRDHRVPLSKEAVALLKATPKTPGTDIVFPGRKGQPLSDMTLSKVTRTMKVEAVPHGFRSTFRDWVADMTNYPNDMAEMALAHKISDEAEAAYRRGHMVEKRRRMMQDWANFIEGKEALSAEVIEFKKGAA